MALIIPPQAEFKRDYQSSEILLGATFTYAVCDDSSDKALAIKLNPSKDIHGDISIDCRDKDVYFNFTYQDITFVSKDATFQDVRFVDIYLNYQDPTTL